jgi:hypothetical protein
MVDLPAAVANPAARHVQQRRATEPRSLPQREALLAAAVSAVVASLLLWLGPPGRDLAAHAYQREFFLNHGFMLWNNFWYAGRYSYVSYSLLYYPLAAVLGIAPLAVASISAAGFGFAHVVVREWGASARWASRGFALVWACTVLSAAYPFGLGIALALLALASLQRRALGRFGVLTALALAASPLAFALLALTLAAVCVARRRRRSDLVAPAVTIAAFLVVEIVLRRLFPDGGRYPFPLGEFVAVCVFCVIGAALTIRIAHARVLTSLFVIYLLATTVAFAVPSSVGENIARLRFAAIPIALLTVSLRRWRPLLVSLVALGLATSWNLSPLAANLVSGRNDPSANEEFWRPAIDFLKTHSSAAYRAEVVDTEGHWGAVYLPQAGIPVARGWFRQDDFPLNAILYRHFGKASYLEWLRRLSVRYVVLPHGPLDYSARREAALLRSGRSGLRVVWRGRSMTIFALPQPRPIVVGAHRANVLAVTPTRVRLRLSGPGRYRVAIRKSPYWHASHGCLSPTADGMLSLRVGRAGAVELRFSVTRDDLIETLAGKRDACRP